jgi:hypothetical protein
MADMNKFNDELLEAGVSLGCDGLHPSSKGARVHFSGKNRTVIAGPFPESKELIAGFWLWQVKSLEEAIEWVKRCPNPHEGDTDIEIRQILEPEDFASAFNDDEIQQKTKLPRSNGSSSSQEIVPLALTYPNWCDR